MTAPAAAFPAAAPTTAPAAAPLALGCLSCFATGGFAGSVAAGGFAGCVCADAWGTIAVVMERAIASDTTFAECFKWPPTELLCFRSTNMDSTGHLFDPLPVASMLIRGNALRRATRIPVILKNPDAMSGFIPDQSTEKATAGVALASRRKP